MMRYFRLYMHFLQFSFSKAMEFRMDFMFRILMDCIYYLVNIALFKVLYLHTNIIGGWTHDQMMVFVGSYLLVDAISMTVFSSNMWSLPIYINKGDLDYYLIRPVSPLFFLSLREFSANSFINLLIAIGIFLYTIVSYSGDWSIFQLIGLIVLLINGTLIHYCLQMLMIIPVFWTHGTRGFIDLFYTISIAMERPHKIFTGWIKILFTTILPFAMIASFPAKFFIEGFTIQNVIHITLVSAAMWVAVLFLWRIGVKNYSSASS